MEYNVPIPLPPAYLVDYDDILGVDCDQAAGNVAVFMVPHKCSVKECLAAVTETCSGATTTPVVKFYRRPTAGSDTGRVEIASLDLGTLAAGKTMFDLAGIGTALEPGEEVVVALSTPAAGVPAAGHFRPALTVEYSPEKRSNLADLVETA